MSLKKKVKKSVPYSLAITILKFSLSLVGMVLLVRYLSAEEYGILLLFSNLPGMLNVLLAFGYDFYITRYFPSLEDRREINSRFTLIVTNRLFFTLVISIILLLTYDYYSEPFGLGDNKLAFSIFQIGLIASTAKIYFDLFFHARYLQKYIVISNITGQIFQVALINLGILLKWPFINFVVIITISFFLEFLVASTYFMKNFGLFRFGNFFKIINNKEEQSYRYASYFNGLGISFLGTNSDKYLLAYFSNISQVAIYGLATSLLRKLNQFLPVSLFGPIIESTFYSKYDKTKDRNDLNQMFQFIFILQFSIALPIIFIFMLAGKDMLLFLFDKPYVLKSYEVIIVFLIYLFISSIPIGMVAKAIEKPKIILISKYTVIINLGLGIPAAIEFGGIGLAIVTMFCAFLSKMTVFVLTNRIVSVSFPYKQIFKISFCAILVFVSIYLQTELFNYHWTFIVLIFIIFYFLMLKVTRLFTKEQKELLIYLVPHKIKRIIQKLI